MAPNNNGNNGKRKVKLDVEVDLQSRQASADLRKFGSKVNKLGSLADRGQNVQDGFLSKKQVQLFKDLVNEMNQIQNQYVSQLNQFGSKLNTITPQIASYQKKLNDAMDASKGRGIGSRPDTESTAVRFYRQKIDDLTSERDSLLSQQTKTKATYDKMNNRGKEADTSIDSITNMHQLNRRGQNILSGVNFGARALGLTWGIHSGLDYMGDAIHLVRNSEQQASYLGGQTGNYNFSGIVSLAQHAGLPMGYTGLQTMQQMGTLLNTGGFTNYKNLLSDTQAAQVFGRAQGVDPNNLLSAGGMMQQMGAMGSGDMRQFADLLAGAIQRSGMQGRQQEMIQATSQLVGTINTKMLGNMSSSEMGNAVALQGYLGSQNSQFRGMQGAQVLGALNNAMTSGNPMMDIMMGYGSKYTGMQGYWNLQMQEDKGIGDPQNLATLSQNIKAMNNPTGAKEWLMQSTGLSAQTVQALWNTGIFSGKGIPTQQQLQQAGAIMNQSGSGQYSQTSQGWYNQSQAMAQQDQYGIGVPLERAATIAQTAFYGTGAIGMAGMIGAGMYYGGTGKGQRSLLKGIGRVVKTYGSTIGERVGGAGFWKGTGGLGRSMSTMARTGSTAGRLGGLGKLLGFGAEGAEFAGLEGAGLALDSTGVLAPLGLALGAVGLMAGSGMLGRKRGQGIGQPLPGSTGSTDGSGSTGDLTGTTIDTLTVKSMILPTDPGSIRTATGDKFVGFGTGSANGQRGTLVVPNKITVTFNGSVAGMTPEAQKNASESFGEYLSNLFSWLTQNNNNYNLASDQTRN